MFLCMYVLRKYARVLCKVPRQGKTDSVRYKSIAKDLQSIRGTPLWEAIVQTI